MIKKQAKTFGVKVLARLRALRSKEWNEFRYWRRRKINEGTLSNSHYAKFYTTVFGLEPEYYESKRILDIGCGPRGSLEWADMAKQRVGLDPLADDYRQLGTANHKMEYIASGAESIPFPASHFHVVCSFNSLDHVSNLEKTISEIKRVTASGGLFLLISDVNHDPTPCEPISFSWEIIERFSPEFLLCENTHFEKQAGGTYESIEERALYDHDDLTKRYGIIAAKLLRR